MVSQLNENAVIGYESLERDAYTMLFNSVGPLAMDLGLTYMQNGEITQFACSESPKVTILNRLIGLGLGKPASYEEIDLAVRRAQTLKVSCSAYVINGYNHPVNLNKMLQQRGFTLKAQGSVLIFEPEADFKLPTLAGEVQVELVNQARQEDFAETVCEGFELRGGFWRVWEAISLASIGHPQQVSYLAYVDDKPAGGTSLAFSKDGRSAILYATATLPQYRHHGVQTALIQAALSEAKKRNVSILLGHTPSDSNAQHNLLRNGFKIAYLRDNYQVGLEYK